MPSRYLDVDQYPANTDQDLVTKRKALEEPNTPTAKRLKSSHDESENTKRKVLEESNNTTTTVSQNEPEPDIQPTLLNHLSPFQEKV